MASVKRIKLIFMMLMTLAVVSTPALGFVPIVAVLLALASIYLTYAVKQKVGFTKGRSTMFLAIFLPTTLACTEISTQGYVYKPSPSMAETGYETTYQEGLSPFTSCQYDRAEYLVVKTAPYMTISSMSFLLFSAIIVIFMRDAFPNSYVTLILTCIFVCVQSLLMSIVISLQMVSSYNYAVASPMLASIFTIMWFITGNNNTASMLVAMVQILTMSSHYFFWSVFPCLKYMKTNGFTKYVHVSTECTRDAQTVSTPQMVPNWMLTLGVLFGILDSATAYNTADIQNVWLSTLAVAIIFAMTFRGYYKLLSILPFAPLLLGVMVCFYHYSSNAILDTIMTWVLWILSYIPVDTYSFAASVRATLVKILAVYTWQQCFGNFIALCYYDYYIWPIILCIRSIWYYELVHYYGPTRKTAIIVIKDLCFLWIFKKTMLTELLILVLQLKYVATTTYKPYIQVIIALYSILIDPNILLHYNIRSIVYDFNQEKIPPVRLNYIDGQLVFIVIKDTEPLPSLSSNYVKTYDILAWLPIIRGDAILVLTAVFMDMMIAPSIYFPIPHIQWLNVYRLPDHFSVILKPLFYTNTLTTELFLMHIGNDYTEIMCFGPMAKPISTQILTIMNVPLDDRNIIYVRDTTHTVCTLADYQANNHYTVIANFLDTHSSVDTVLKTIFDVAASIIVVVVKLLLVMLLYFRYIIVLAVFFFQFKLVHAHQNTETTYSEAIQIFLTVLILLCFVVTKWQTYNVRWDGWSFKIKMILTLIIKCCVHHYILPISCVGHIAIYCFLKDNNLAGKLRRYKSVAVIGLALALCFDPTILCYTQIRTALLAMLLPVGPTYIHRVNVGDRNDGVPGHYFSLIKYRSNLKYSTNAPIFTIFDMLIWLPLCCMHEPKYIFVVFIDMLYGKPIYLTTFDWSLFKIMRLPKEMFYAVLRVMYYGTEITDLMMVKNSTNGFSALMNINHDCELIPPNHFTPTKEVFHVKLGITTLAYVKSTAGNPSVDLVYNGNILDYIVDTIQQTTMFYVRHAPTVNDMSRFIVIFLVNLLYVFATKMKILTCFLVFTMFWQRSWAFTRFETYSPDTSIGYDIYIYGIFAIIAMALYINMVMRHVLNNPIQILATVGTIIISMTTSTPLTIIGLLINIALTLLSYFLSYGDIVFTGSDFIITMITSMTVKMIFQLSCWFLFNPFWMMTQVFDYFHLSLFLVIYGILFGMTIFMDVLSMGLFAPQEVLYKNVITGKVESRVLKHTILGALLFSNIIGSNSGAFKVVTNSLENSMPTNVTPAMSRFLHAYGGVDGNYIAITKDLFKTASKLGIVQELLDNIDNNKPIPDILATPGIKCNIPLKSLVRIRVNGCNVANGIAVQTKLGPVVVCNVHSIALKDNDKIVIHKDLGVIDCNDQIAKARVMSYSPKADVAILKVNTLKLIYAKVAPLKVGASYIWVGYQPDLKDKQSLFMHPIRLGMGGVGTGAQAEFGDSGSVLINNKGEIVGMKWGALVNLDDTLSDVNYFVDLGALNTLDATRLVASTSLIDLEQCVNDRKYKEFVQIFSGDSKDLISQLTKAQCDGDKEKINELLPLAHRNVQLGKSFSKLLTSEFVARKQDMNMKKALAGNNPEVQAIRADLMNIELEITMLTHSLSELDTGINDEVTDELQRQLATLRAKLIEHKQKNAVVPSRELLVARKTLIQKQLERKDAMRKIRQLTGDEPDAETTATKAALKELNKEVLDLDHTIRDIVCNIDECRMPGTVEKWSFPYWYKKADGTFVTLLSDTEIYETIRHPIRDQVITTMAASYGLTAKAFKKLLLSNGTTEDWHNMRVKNCTIATLIRKVVGFMKPFTYEADCPFCAETFNCNEKHDEQCGTKCVKHVEKRIDAHLKQCSGNRYDLTAHTATIQQYDFTLRGVPNGYCLTMGETATCEYGSDVTHTCLINDARVKQAISADPKFKLNRYIRLKQTNNSDEVMYVPIKCFHSTLYTASRERNVQTDLQDKVECILEQVCTFGNTLRNMATRRQLPPPQVVPKFVKANPILSGANATPLGNSLNSDNEGSLPLPTKNWGDDTDSAASTDYKPRRRRSRRVKVKQTDLQPPQKYFPFLPKKYIKDDMEVTHDTLIHGDCKCPLHCCTKNCACHICISNFCVWCNDVDHKTSECDKSINKKCNDCNEPIPNWESITYKEQPHFHCINGISNNCVLCDGNHHSMMCPIVKKNTRKQKLDNIMVPVFISDPAGFVDCFTIPNITTPQRQALRNRSPFLGRDRQHSNGGSPVPNG